MLNLVAPLILNSMQSAHAVDREATAAKVQLARDERESIAEKVASLRNGVRQLRDLQWQA